MVGRQEGHTSVKTRMVRCWRGYLSDTGSPSSPGQRAVKRVCACVRVYDYLRNCSLYVIVITGEELV